MILFLIAAGVIITLVLDNPTSQIVTGLGAPAAALGITWKGVGSVTDKLFLAIGRPLWGAEIDASVSHALTYLPTEPIMEPQNAVLLRTPQYLRAVVAATKASGADPTEAQVLATLRRIPGASGERLGPFDYITMRDRLWRKPSAQELRYWLTWAASAGYVTKTDDAYRLTGEGSRLAELPSRAQGAVRAALTAGRQSADNA